MNAEIDFVVLPRLGADAYVTTVAAVLTANDLWICLCLQATEKQAQTPNPPPETFNPIKTRKGTGKSAVDPASLAAAAASAAKTLATGSPQDVGAVSASFRWPSFSSGDGLVACRAVVCELTLSTQSVSR